MHTLPQLPYSYDALEPYFDAMTMEIHHSKHHQAYIDKLNEALNGSGLEDKSIEELLRDLKDVPDSIRVAVQNHGGGHYNHSLFWESLTPAGSTENTMSTGLSDKLTETFGSIEKMKEDFKKTALSRFGSGWAWIVKKDTGELAIISTANQDSPLSENMSPILGLDVWEHAYYLKYQNKRADFVDAFWNLVNWQKVEKRLG